MCEFRARASGDARETTHLVVLARKLAMRRLQSRKLGIAAVPEGEFLKMIKLFQPDGPVPRRSLPRRGAAAAPMPSAPGLLMGQGPSIPRAVMAIRLIRPVRRRSLEKVIRSPSPRAPPASPGSTQAERGAPPRGVKDHHCRP
jgi:hypothetical protein